MSDLTLWDDPAEVPAERPIWNRPRWDYDFPCHVCGAHLTRWVAVNSGGYADGWYSWELMEPSWKHLRQHWAEMRLIAIIPGPIRNGQIP